MRKIKSIGHFMRKTITKGHKSKFCIFKLRQVPLWVHRAVKKQGVTLFSCVGCQ